MIPHSLIHHLLIEELRSGALKLPDFLSQVEALFIEHEPSILAFLPEEDRFKRVRSEADELVVHYPDLIKRPLLFGALAGVKDIFQVDGFTTKAGSRLPPDLFQREEAKSVTRLKEA